MKLATDDYQVPVLGAGQDDGTSYVTLGAKDRITARVIEMEAVPERWLERFLRLSAGRLTVLSKKVTEFVPGDVRGYMALYGKVVKDQGPMTIVAFPGLTNEISQVTDNKAARKIYIRKDRPIPNHYMAAVLRMHEGPFVSYGITYPGVLRMPDSAACWFEWDGISGREFGHAGHVGLGQVLGGCRLCDGERGKLRRPDYSSSHLDSIYQHLAHLLEGYEHDPLCWGCVLGWWDVRTDFIPPEYANGTTLAARLLDWWRETTLNPRKRLPMPNDHPEEPPVAVPIVPPEPVFGGTRFVGSSEVIGDRPLTNAQSLRLESADDIIPGLASLAAEPKRINITLGDKFVAQNLRRKLHRLLGDGWGLAFLGRDNSAIMGEAWTKSAIPFGLNFEEDDAWPDEYETPIGFPALKAPVKHRLDDVPTTIQWAVDLVFGEANYRDQTYDGWIESRDWEAKPGMILRPAAGPVKPPAPPRYAPVLHTVMPVRREQSVFELAYASGKRNLDVPHIMGVRAAKESASELFDCFLDLMVDREPFEIEVSLEDATDWLNGQTLPDPSVVIPDIPIDQCDVVRYFLSMKRLPKPDLTPAATERYQAPQTIAYLDKYFNAVFSPKLRALKKAITAKLKPGFIWYVDMTPEELCRQLDDCRLRGDPIAPHTGDDNLIYHQDVGWIECDQSKFDKSLGEEKHEFDLRLFRHTVGTAAFTEWELELWDRANYTSTYYSPVGVKFQVRFETRSGGPWTSGGNTTYEMACMHQAVGLRGDRPFDPGETVRILCDVHNLEAKVGVWKYPMFCSKFLVETSHGFVLAPDPVKLLVKLGRTDIRTDEHFRGFCLSFKDHAKAYEDLEVCMSVAQGLIERYHIEYDLTMLLHQLPTVADNVDRYFVKTSEE